MQPTDTQPRHLDPTGLTSAQVAERVSRGQTNTQPARGGRTTWQIVRDNVFTRINAMLTVLLATTPSRSRSTRARSSAGSPPSRSGRWSVPCGAAATRSR